MAKKRRFEKAIWVANATEEGWAAIALSEGGEHIARADEVVAGTVG
jgi:hypothetical protein